MLVIIGIVGVLLAVIVGFLWEGGHIGVLLQPAELLIIGGAAGGTLLIANPVHVLKKIAGGISGAFGASKYTKQRYMDTLKMLMELFTRGRREGLVSLESDSDEPEKSPTLSKYPEFLKDHHAVMFLCDTLRMAASGGVEPFDIDQVLEMDMEVHDHGQSQPIASLTTVADALPGLGIVAAVLGVVVTMGSLGGPPEEIGHKVAAALVGTFLGILLCYGVVGPVASKLAKEAEEEHAFYMFLRVSVIAFMKGMAPVIAVEFGRRVIPGHLRPGFLEAEEFIKRKPETAAAPAAEAAAPAHAQG